MDRSTAILNSVTETSVLCAVKHLEDRGSNGAVLTSINSDCNIKPPSLVLSAAIKQKLNKLLSDGVIECHKEKKRRFYSVTQVGHRLLEGLQAVSAEGLN